ncbi:hypothetical protein JW872_00160 [Candidatus Babeliales bacterium]|nr:hypothetical protein [Candidatus Babeliales bacterium]
MNPGRLFLVSAPSGAGKSSLVAAVIEQLASSYSIRRVITYTTKHPRQGEVEGVDYHYIGEVEFLRKLDEGFFLESSTAYHAYYGSPRSIITDLAQGHSWILVVDRVGALRILEEVSDVVAIWITVPFNSLAQRLRERGTESEEQIQYRIEQGKSEQAQEDARSLYSHVIVNDDFNSAVVQLGNLIISYIDAARR